MARPIFPISSTEAGSQIKSFRLVLKGADKAVEHFPILAFVFERRRKRRGGIIGTQVNRD